MSPSTVLSTLLSTGSLASASARHPWRAIGAWIAVFVLAVVAVGTLLGGSLTTEGAPTNNPESERALDARVEAFPIDPGTETTDIVVVRSDEHTVDAPQFATFVRDLVDGSETSALANGRTYLDDSSGALVSEDRQATILPLAIYEDEVETVIAEVEAADEDAAFDVAVTGDETLVL